MATVLGLHHGHHASCAVVRDGVVAAAIQQERVTRRKADGQEGMSNALPIRECLAAAGLRLDDIDVIVSSFQALSPGGVGLYRPLVEFDFDTFDPRDERHFVISHHLAHAHAALGASGEPRATVLVCDLAGSTTVDGLDFFVPFSEFESQVTSVTSMFMARTECLSIYSVGEDGFDLLHRDLCVPHNQPDVFVHDAASLYENVSRMVFKQDNAHGQLMALASLSGDVADEDSISADAIVAVAPDDSVTFRNDWQHRVTNRADPLEHVGLARAAQIALQRALLAHARRARAVGTHDVLVAAGGVFLNILANTAIAESGLFRRYFVPSSPHDAGISLGCAYAGDRRASRSAEGGRRRPAADRLGPVYDDAAIRRAVSRYADRVTVIEHQASARVVAHRLAAGEIVARFAGRSEFGPRALGGRSLLASPLLAGSKDRLNEVKGRQPWRPVAPVVLADRLSEFFTGPDDSPYMNFVHQVRACYVDSLAALRHPDGSTRCQTLTQDDDQELYEIITEFARLTGFPVLVNTSLNARGEPIVETPDQALDLLMKSADVGSLMLGNLLVGRTEIRWQLARFAPDTLVTTVHPGRRRRIVLVRAGASLEVSAGTLAVLEAVHDGGDRADVGSVDDEVITELTDGVRLGLLFPIRSA